MHWSYCSLALSHRYVLMISIKSSSWVVLMGPHSCDSFIFLSLHDYYLLLVFVFFKSCFFGIRRWKFLYFDESCMIHAWLIKIQKFPSPNTKKQDFMHDSSKYKNFHLLIPKNKIWRTQKQAANILFNMAGFSWISMTQPFFFKYSQKKLHISSVRVKYGTSFVCAKSDLYPTLTIVMLYGISCWLLTCWIVLKTSNDIFTFWIISWLWLDPSRWN